MGKIADALQKKREIEAENLLLEAVKRNQQLKFNIASERLKIADEILEFVDDQNRALRVSIIQALSKWARTIPNA